MWSQQVFVTYLLAYVTLQFAAAVVNTGQTKKVEETIKTISENKNNEKTNSNSVGDLITDRSEEANRRELSTTYQKYGTPSLPSVSSGHFKLPVPVYGVPNAPSNNVIYPAPPPDFPPPPPKPLPSSLYGVPIFGKTYGTPQINPLPPISNGYGPPPIKYGTPFSFKEYSTNLVPPKPVYGPSKNIYSSFGKPLKYNKGSLNNFGIRPPKPYYGAPINLKDNFSYNNINTNNKNFNSFSGLYSGVSSLNHQYGAPVVPPNQAIFLQYETPSAGLSTQYGLPQKSIVEPPLVAYGPPQPSPNPRPPHPGVPAPPTPPDIKYDGWQPIPGLVSKRPTEEISHIASQSSGYKDIFSLSLNGKQNQLGDSYGAPPVTLDITFGNNLLEQPQLSDSYGVPLNSVTGTKTEVRDSYSAPLGSVTGSGGIIASSGAEAHGGSSSNSVSNSQSLSLDLSSIGVGHSSDIQTVKSIEYEIYHDGGYGVKNISKLSSNLVGDGYASENVYNILGSSDQTVGSRGFKSSSFPDTTIGLIPPSGVYGAPPNSRYGTPLDTNNYGNHRSPKRPVKNIDFLPQNVIKDSYNKHSFGNSFSSSYIIPPPTQAGPSISYGTPGNSGAISFQNVVHSPTAGIDIQQNTLDIEGANSSPLTNYHNPSEHVKESYGFQTSGSNINVNLDYTHPSQTVDLTLEKQAALSHDCTSNNHQQHSSFTYDAPFADGYTSSVSALTANIGSLQPQTAELKATYGAASQQHSAVSLPEYNVQDLVSSSSRTTKTKVETNKISEEIHGKNYGKSVAESFGPNSELVESHSIDLNNIPLQGNLGSYTLQIQPAHRSGAQIPHSQVLNDGLLQSILEAIEQPGQQGEHNKYPIILQPSLEKINYSRNETLNSLNESESQASEIQQVIVDSPKTKDSESILDRHENEENLQFLDTSNIALYYKKDVNDKKSEDHDKRSEDHDNEDENSAED